MTTLGELHQRYDRSIPEHLRVQALAGELSVDQAMFECGKLMGRLEALQTLKLYGRSVSREVIELMIERAEAALIRAHDRLNELRKGTPVTP